MRGSGNKEQFLVGSAGSFPEAMFGHIERIGGPPAIISRGTETSSYRPRHPDT